MSAVLRALAVSLALVAVSASAAAGQQGYMAPIATTVAAPPGWSLTPSLGVSQTYDDNVTLQGPANNPVGDLISLLSPGASLNYNGPRSQLTARYDGSFLFYRSSSALDSYAQGGSLGVRRRLSSRTSFFINGSVYAAPTTELLQLTAVPYLRVGSRAEDVAAGVESAISKRLSIVASVHAQGVHFDDNTVFTDSLLGGSSVGATLVLRERLTEKMTLTGDYDSLRADIGQQHDIFVIQNAMVGVERLLTRTMRISGAVGVARLDAPTVGPTNAPTVGSTNAPAVGQTNALTFGPSKAGASYRFALSRNLGRSAVELLLSQSYVPSWTFSGTTQNDEVTLRLRVPLARRLYTQSLVSWRNDKAFVENTPGLKSLWIQATVGYTARPWARIEGFYLSTQQSFVTNDALLHHNQIGFQVIAAKPVRLR